MHNENVGKKTKYWAGYVSYPSGSCVATQGLVDRQGAESPSPNDSHGNGKNGGGGDGTPMTVRLVRASIGIYLAGRLRRKCYVLGSASISG